MKSKIEELAGDENAVEGSAVPSVDTSNLVPPRIDLPDASLCASGLKCLNMLGILWAGRGHSRRYCFESAASAMHAYQLIFLTILFDRSFLYLLASKSLYDQTAELINLSSKDAAEIESTFTHNLFYLAQAYGNHGDTTQSSYYCHMVSRL